MRSEIPATAGGVRGTVGDRPWGITLAALGLDGSTGELTLRAEGRVYRIVFFRGVIVGATSPLPADSALRVALTSKLVTTEQADELRARIKQDKGRRPRRAITTVDCDEVDVIGETLHWTDAQADQLRNAVIARAAARTFAVDRGDYVLEDRIAHTSAEGHVDVRAAVYLGVRMHLSDARLAYDLRQLGSWFVLKPKTVVDLSGFAFGDIEGQILEQLRGGANLAALEARDRAIDPRTAQAVLYALAACDAVVCGEPPAMTSTLDTPPVEQPPTMTRVPTPRQPTISRVPTPRIPNVTDTSPWGIPTISVRSRPLVASGEVGTGYVTDTSPWGIPTISVRSRPLVASGELGKGSNPRLNAVLRAATVRSMPLAPHEVKAMIVARSTLLDLGADHFQLLGLPPNAPPDDVLAAYTDLARYLEPRKLAALGIPDESHTARRLFAQICIAVTVLTDPDRRKQYVAALRNA